MNTNFLGTVIAVAMAFLLLGLRHLILTVGKKKKRKSASSRSSDQYTFKPLPEETSSSSRAARQMVQPGDRSLISAEQFLAELRAHARAGASSDISGEAGSVLEFDINRRSTRTQ